MEEEDNRMYNELSTLFDPKETNDKVVDAAISSNVVGVLSNVKFWFVTEPTTVLNKLETLFDMQDYINERGKTNQVIFWQRGESDTDWGVTMKRIENLKKRKDSQKESWKRSWGYVTEDGEPYLKSYDVYTDSNVPIPMNSVRGENVSIVKALFDLVKEKKKVRVVF